MNEDSLARALDFMLRYARLIDRHLFAWKFAAAPADAVLAALRPYQNPDGGFGNALEPDKRCPESQPVDVQVAFEILDLVSRPEDSLIRPVLEFLDSIATPEGGLPFALPSVMRYPRAPWWEADSNPPASLNPTAAITGLLHKWGIEHPFVARSTEYCWQAIAASESTFYHEIMPMIAFLEHVSDRARAGQELERIAKRVAQPGVIAYTPDAEGYVKFPLDWAPRPDSYLRRLFSDEILAAQLRSLADRQQEDGGWPVNWTALSPAVEYEWRGWVTFQALCTLQAYQEAGFQ